MIVAIDPGKSGGCVLASHDHLEAVPWKSPEQMAAKLAQHKIQRAYLEHVFGTATLTHAKIFEFGRNVGQWEGILQTLSVDRTYVKPRTWQFPLRIYERIYKKRKSALLKVAKQKFSDLGRVTLATCDAWLILEWAIKTDPLCKDLESVLKP
jgi:hypothetical protein|tara:strand:- start:206 stop:661 length:456 start_codon:yes stop_codon:yes gene_type:complete